MAQGNVKKGNVIAVQGPVVDVKFAPGAELPMLREIIRTRAFDGRPYLRSNFGRMMENAWM